MMRKLLSALFAGLICLSRAPAADASPDFAARFQDPPLEDRILKIIHSWPDDPGAQDGLFRTLSSQGFGGVVCNVSFADYLQSEPKWKAFVRAVQQAKAAGFALWLYDEKGYPSATAGGLVLRDHPEWEARGLLIADLEVENTTAKLDLPPGKPKLVAAWPVISNTLNPKQQTNLVGCIASGKLIWEPPPGRWRVLAITEDRLYEGTHASQSLSDHIPYPNLLDAQPTERFLQLTHDAYAQHLGTNLGRYFVSTFTDEPSLMSLFLRAMPYRVLPWSTNLVAAFRREHGYDIEEKLAALVAEAGPETARVRYDFWNTVGTLVSENFFGQIQAWCKTHGVRSGGHLLMEESLVGHVPLYGDFFRCLRRLDAPGIDCLTSLPEQVPWFIARLAGSAAELEGRTVTMCETSDHSQRYRSADDKRPVQKVTEDEIRGTCNRLMVSGIDTITSYYSFDGLDAAQLKRINEYVGRCCRALKGGHQVADIAVLYPVESIWVRFTPARHYVNDSPSAAAMENVWRDISEGLFADGREFTYVDSRSLGEARVENGALVHGNLRWRVVILPAADTLPIKAWRNLLAFVEAGGVVISVGALPSNSDAQFPSPEVKDLTAKMFKPGTTAPTTLAHPAGGAGIYLPAGLASMVPDVVDKVLQRGVLTGQERSPLRHTHRRIDGREVYFLINDSPRDWRGKVSLAVEGSGAQWDPATGTSNALPSGEGIELHLPAYCGTLFTFGQERTPGLNRPGERILPEFSLRDLPPTNPTAARGEFVREHVSPAGSESWYSGSTSAVWKAAATLTKGQVDTYFFLRFEYKESPNLRGARALILESWVPPNQHAPAQLLAILHEKGGADYLAHSGRLLNAPGREETWIALDRFQLAGWSKDTNAVLDPDQINEVRIGWGGYYGNENENITFTVASPRVAATEPTGPTNAGEQRTADFQSLVDLRPQFARFALAQRRQGGRPTCSAFTVAGALEFAAARHQGKGCRLSVDFLNWAANKACGDTADGGFFSDLWKGYEQYGICTEELMSYDATFNPQRAPGPEALADAKSRFQLALRLHWIKEWNVNTGLTDSELSGIKRTLGQGWPVCGGFRWPVHERWEQDVLQICPANAVRDGHSVLLVGYRDDSKQPGGGVFIFRNTAGQGQDGSMPYAYAMEFMNDAVWVDYDPASRPAGPP